MLSRLTYIALAVSAATGSLHAQTTVLVDKDSPTPTAPYSTWATASHDLQVAIDSLPIGGGDVLVAEGSYRPSQPFPAGAGSKFETFLIDGSSLSTSDEICVHGGYKGYIAGQTTSTDPNAPDGSFDSTVLRGTGGGVRRHHVVTVADVAIDAAVVIDGFKITTGVADGAAVDGADIGGGLNVVNNTGTDQYGSVVVENCWFDANLATAAGGAIHFAPESTQYPPNVIRHCEFTDNTATRGGAVYLSTKTGLNLGNVYFRGNGSLDIPDSPAAVQGGAIFMEAATGQTVIANGVFFENKAIEEGAAIYYEVADTNPGFGQDTLVIGNCTIAFNTIRHPNQNVAGAGGVHVATPNGNPAFFSKTHLAIYNSIVWQNESAGASFGSYVDVELENLGSLAAADFQYSDFTSTSSLIGVPGTFPTLTYVNPVFVNPGAGNLRLANLIGTGGAPASPLIDQGGDGLLCCLDSADVDGSPGTTLTIDLDGTVRAYDFQGVTGPAGVVDLGAYEAQEPFQF